MASYSAVRPPFNGIIESGGSINARNNSPDDRYSLEDIKRLLEEQSVSPVIHPVIRVEKKPTPIRVEGVSDTLEKSVSSKSKKTVSSVRSKSVSSRTTRHDTPVSLKPKKTVSDTLEKSVSSQFKTAVSWLQKYPDKQGLSFRKAADKAGVSLATLQRANDYLNPVKETL